MDPHRELIRAVLDTNVLASGIAGFIQPHSAPGLLLRAWQAGRFELIVSEHILVELAFVLDKPYFLRRIPADRAAWAGVVLRRQATVVVVTDGMPGVAADPGDDAILATAVAGRAEFIVTGDVALRALGSHAGIAVVSPREFLDLLSNA